METWKPVVGYEGVYEVSDCGRVKTVASGKIKTPTDQKSRLVCLLWRNNRAKCARIHRLVLEAFVGKAPSKHECCHNDGNYRNNNLSNLRWDTAAENQADRVKHGTSNRGERCGSAKLKVAQAQAIRLDPRTHREISRDYGIGSAQVSRIKTGARWAHLEVSN